MQRFLGGKEGPEKLEHPEHAESMCHSAREKVIDQTMAGFLHAGGCHTQSV